MKTKVQSPDKSSGAPFRSRGAIQAKLAVNQPGDQHENEADTAADRVVNGASPTGTTSANSSAVQLKPIAQTVTPRIQRKEAPGQMGQLDVEGTEDKMGAIGHEGIIQRKEDQSMSNQFLSPSSENAPLGDKLQETKGQGNPLPSEVNSEMKTNFGADFTDVKIHTGTKAEEMNTSLGAEAFTNKNDIYFNTNKFSPTTTQGKFLLAHELTHTIQQGAVPIQQPGAKEEVNNVKTENTALTKETGSTTTNSVLKTNNQNKTISKNDFLGTEKKLPQEITNFIGVNQDQKDPATTDVTDASVKQPETNTSKSTDFTETKTADQNSQSKSADNSVKNPVNDLDMSFGTGDTKNAVSTTSGISVLPAAKDADTEQNVIDASGKQPVNNTGESNNLTETKNADQNNLSKSADNSVTNSANVPNLGSGTGEIKNSGNTTSNVSGLPVNNATNTADVKQGNANDLNANTNISPTVTTNEPGTATDEKSDVKSEQMPTDQSDKEVVTPVAKEAIDIHKEISAFKQRTSWYKSNASAMINGHISEIRSNANQQVQKVNTSASNNSKWISNSYDSTLKNIEKQRKGAVHEILESKKKEKASIRNNKWEQLKELDRGTWKRVKTLRSDGEKIVKSAKENGVKQIKEIDDCNTNAYTKTKDYIDNRVKHHHVTDRKVRMVFRLTGIAAGGLEQIEEVNKELKEKVNEQTSELVERIREEYNTAADALPEEKENIRQAIIDAADAALEGIDAIDVSTAIKQLNDDIQRLKDKLLKEKAEVLNAIEDARKQSIKEIRHEESIRIADFKNQLADYTAGVDQVRQEVKEEIADKPDILVKELLDLAIKKTRWVTSSPAC